MSCRPVWPARCTRRKARARQPVLQKQMSFLERAPAAQRVGSPWRSGSGAMYWWRPAGLFARWSILATSNRFGRGSRPERCASSVNCWFTKKITPRWRGCWAQHLTGRTCLQPLPWLRMTSKTSATGSGRPCGPLFRQAKSRSRTRPFW